MNPEGNVIQFAGEGSTIDVPGWVRDVQSFRRWSDSDGFPQDRPVWWIDGRLWIDVTKEQLYTHLMVKAEYYYHLTRVVKEGNLGMFIPDGLLLSNFAAKISGNPDGTFLSHETLHSDRVRLLEGARGGITEVQGSPDMVLEVVSASSVRKDYDWLRKAYWEADIREYWLVDAREEPVKFEVFRHAPRGYAAARKSDGWVKSAVFGRSFKLAQRTNDLGHPEFALAVR
ncbi:MAG TPA: Uma2 family endonuclease [Gemmataceae bacterium]|nr:Uma2 family endonuclease [Gemmataceae bacterium]